SAMAAIDQLILGMPQSIQDGVILLGLSSVHIYRDLLVLRKQHTIAQFDDSIVTKAGLPTIGLEIMHHIHSSVCWSLPLSQFRYYGGAITSERALII
ncbi:hypothetical protein BKA67DRAFT_521325, partial [Truncatella angustata]